MGDDSNNKKNLKNKNNKDNKGLTTFIIKFK